MAACMNWAAGLFIWCNPANLYPLEYPHVRLLVGFLATSKLLTKGNMYLCNYPAKLVPTARAAWALKVKKN